MAIIVRRLVPSGAAAFQALRLAALTECPSAFSSSYEEECGTPLATIEARFAPDSGRHMFGAFDGAVLVGMVGVGRETAPKLRHKAFIRAMYVAPSHRGKGVGRQLLEQALACASSMQGLRQINLDVTAGKAPALALYESLGFAVFGREPSAMLVDGVLHDKLYLARLLD
ncbi:MAG: GNAT family N-acetyltransferase [Pseudomonadota bacterium]